MISSTLRIISAASAAEMSTCRFTWKDSVIPSSTMSPTHPFAMSGECVCVCVCVCVGVGVCSFRMPPQPSKSQPSLANSEQSHHSPSPEVLFPSEWRALS